MTEIMQRISEFALGNSIWVYLFIFVGKITEVSLGTLRIVLINRGVRTAGSLIAFVEIMLWLLVASSVLAGFSQDFLKGIVYAFAFACGNYLGSWLDELLAFGISQVQVVIPDTNEAKLVEEALRARDLGVTAIDVHGRDCDHYMLGMTIKRKRLAEVIRWLESNCKEAVITVTDIKAQRGGYFKRAGIRNGEFRIGK